MSITTQDIIKKKKERERIIALTAYDCVTAKILDENGVDLILVGDSYGMVALGYDNTLPVTVDEMITITKAVSRGSSNALIVADMPFMSYHSDIKTARENAGRFIKETRAGAVKIENSGNVEEIIKSVIDIDIPVMGHIGITPQSIHRMGGYKAQGKTEDMALRLINDAKKLEELGAFSLVLEYVPRQIAKIITESLTIPTIGIGSGPHCDGQVLVINDILGYYKDNIPKHSKRYCNLRLEVARAIKAYITDIRTGLFPSIDNAAMIDEDVLEAVRKKL